MEQMQTHGKDSTKTRCARAMKSKAFDGIRASVLIQTKAERIRVILEDCTVSTAHYLKRLHNLAYGLGWLPSPLLPAQTMAKIAVQGQTRHHGGRARTDSGSREEPRAEILLPIALGIRDVAK